MDNGWDHTENEDKVLLNQSWDLGQVRDQDMEVTDKVRSMVSTRVGCSKDTSSNYQMDNISSDYNNYLSTVGLNKVNRNHIFLFDLIPTNLSYFCSTVSSIRNSIFNSLKLLASTSDVLSNVESERNSSSDISEFNSFLTNNKAKLKDLHQDLLNLSDSFGYTSYLINQSNLKDCNKGTSTCDSKTSEIIKKIISSLCNLDRIECLVISARSTIQEIKKAKDQLMTSTSPIPPEHLKSVYFQMNFWSSNIDIMFRAIQGAEINTWCLKYWICKFVDSSNKNSLSTLSVNYIGYFYYVFPLHLDTFNRLFSDVINPKLPTLISSVCQFTGLTGDISEFIESLKGVSKYLNVNPAQALLNLISKFNRDSYAQKVGSNIQQLIKELENKMKYDQIIHGVQSLAIPYNQALKSAYESFKSKIDQHRKSLETNIKKFIFYIRYDLNINSFRVNQLISKISQDIKNLSTNQGKLNQFTKYTKKEEIIRKCTRFEKRVSENYEKIFNTHTKYKECLNKCCSEITSELDKLMREMRFYNGYIVFIKNIINQSNNAIIHSSIIEKITSGLNSVKRLYVSRFYTHLSGVQKLEKIGEHIRHMKSSLNPIKDKVLPQVKNYIEDLKDIKVDSGQFEKDIRKITLMNNIIIGKLHIAKHTIEFYKSLESEISKLNDVKFNDYDFTLNLTVKEKLTSFETNINKAISNVKQSFKNIPDHTVFTDSDTHTESYYKKLISPLERLINIISNVIELECGIEGVARNLKWFSLQFYTNICTFLVINHNMDNITFYNPK